MAGRNIQRRLLKIWVAILMCCFVKETQSALTLYINRKFAVDHMKLDVQNDIFLITNGVKNEVFHNRGLFYETTKPMPAELNRVELTWRSLHHEEQYSLRLTSSDLKIMQHPDVKLPSLKGTVSEVSKTFEVNLRCLAKGQVDIHFALNYTNYRTSTGISLQRRLQFTVTKQCNGNAGSSESSKRPVDRTVVVTVTAVLALIVCIAIIGVFFWRYVKRIRRKFGYDERERLAPRTESFSSNISIPVNTSRLPTVVYSPQRNGSRHCFTEIAQHENGLNTITTQGHSQSCAFQDNINTTPENPISFNGNLNGHSWDSNNEDLKLFTQLSINEDDVFISDENDVALIQNYEEQQSTLSFARDVDDKQLAFTTLNEYWSEKLGDSVKTREDVEIRTELLGEGKFGRVLRGRFIVTACEQTETSVIDLAVKVCQEDIVFEHMVSFVNEAILMKRLDHPNLIDLLGVVLQSSSAPLVLTPYMAHGDLHKFLRHSRGIGIRRQLIGSRQLVNFASQISSGMAYLATQKVVHRDLAARNCLVDNHLNVKVSDFGLARDVKQFDLYKMEHPTQLAVKWLALESLLYYIFSEKSDVWSFGIVLWELVTLGSQPYAGLDNYEVMPYLETGKRLPRPLRCPDDLYSIMQSCWSAAPEERPRFNVLVHKLEDYELRLRPACITFEFDEDTIEMSDGCGSF